MCYLLRVYIMCATFSLWRRNVDSMHHGVLYRVFHWVILLNTHCLNTTGLFEKLLIKRKTLLDVSWLCFYDIGLWRFYRFGNLHKLASAYVKCIKIFFGCNKYYSVTQMLIQLGLPHFNTVVCAKLTGNNRLKSSVQFSSDCLTGVTVMVILWIRYVSYMF